jgi:hypothetical protein
MSTGTKLASFALALAALFGAGYELGGAVGPFDDDTPAPHEQMEMDR